MGASKRDFEEVRQMEVFCIIPENIYLEIPKETRLKFISTKYRESNEYEANKEDDIYMKHYKENRKTKEALEQYLFEKRNNLNA